jgi:hypothetical protein
MKPHFRLLAPDLQSGIDGYADHERDVLTLAFPEGPREFSLSHARDILGEKFHVAKPAGGWREEFSDEEKAKLRPIAETLAMLDGNAFFGTHYIDPAGVEHECFEMYLPQAHALYQDNGGDGGWVGNSSFASSRHPAETPPRIAADVPERQPQVGPDRDGPGTRTDLNSQNDQFVDDHACDDFLSETDKAEMHREYLRHRVRLYGQALWMLLTTNRGDYEDAPWWRIGIMKGLCLIAMLLMRSGIREHRYPGRDPRNWYMSDDVGHFNFGTHYGGWNGNVLKFNRAQFRYCIDSDGDSSL